MCRRATAGARAMLQSNIFADSGNIREFGGYFQCPARANFMRLSLYINVLYK
jgi:hypothetical protein